MNQGESDNWEQKMATNKASTTSQQIIPTFDGKKWILESKDEEFVQVSRIVGFGGEGLRIKDEAQRLCENKKDSKALFYIQ